MGIIRTGKVLNVFIKKLCVVKKGVNKRIDESGLQSFGHIVGMGNRIIKIYIRVSVLEVL